MELLVSLILLGLVLLYVIPSLSLKPNIQNCYNLSDLLLQQTNNKISQRIAKKIASTISIGDTAIIDADNFHFLSNKGNYTLNLFEDLSPQPVDLQLRNIDNVEILKSIKSHFKLKVTRTSVNSYVATFETSHNTYSLTNLVSVAINSEYVTPFSDISKRSINSFVPKQIYNYTYTFGGDIVDN